MGLQNTTNMRDALMRDDRLIFLCNNVARMGRSGGTYSPSEAEHDAQICARIARTQSHGSIRLYNELPVSS